jgi:hypothetical protein
MIHCKALGKDFETKEEMFKELKANKDEIISLKKSQIQKSCEKGISVKARTISVSKLEETNKELHLDDSFYYIAVNTTRILDFHDDLHLDGIWDVTVKARQGLNFLVEDHRLEMNKVAVKKQYVEMFTAMIPFSMVGKSFEGDTQALIYKVPKDKVISKTSKDWLESGDEIEASVRMQYVTIDLAMDSSDPDDTTEKKLFDKHIDDIANKEELEVINFFWAVSEAKNKLESSLVVFGSNSATGQLINLDKNTKAAEQALLIKQEGEAAAQALQDKRDLFL